MIGLAGAHRTGKTTLAKAYAETTGAPFVTISAGAVIARMGWECRYISSVEDRIAVQSELVAECDKVFSRHRTPFISDRTPLDVAAYLVADLGQTPIAPELEKKAMELVEDCFDITNAFFGAIALLPIALPYVAEPGKPPENAAYQAHIQYLIQGLLQDQRNSVTHYLISPTALSVPDRVGALGQVYGHMVENDCYVSQVVTKM